MSRKDINLLNKILNNQFIVDYESQTSNFKLNVLFAEADVDYNGCYSVEDDDSYDEWNYTLIFLNEHILDYESLICMNKHDDKELEIFLALLNPFTFINLLVKDNLAEKLINKKQATIDYGFFKMNINYNNRPEDINQYYGRFGL